MLDLVNLPIRLFITDILNITLIENSFIFINVWWFVHVISSIVGAFIFLKVKTPRKFILPVVFSIAVLYEILEWFAYSSWIPSLFISEVRIDIMWDLIASVVGICLVLWFTRD